MLFLVKGELRHEALWRKWFERAEGLLPIQAVSNALCSGETPLSKVIAACSAQGADAQQPQEQEQPQQRLGASTASKGSLGGGAARGLGSDWRPGRPRAARGVDILARQHLFDVYVHPHPNFTGEWWGSLWAGAWGAGSALDMFLFCAWFNML